MPNKNSKGTSPSQKSSQNMTTAAINKSTTINNTIIGNTLSTANNFNSMTSSRRSSELSAGNMATTTSQRIHSDSHYLTSPISSTTTSSASYQLNKTKSNQITPRPFPLTNRSMPTSQYTTTSTIASLNNFGGGENFAYMVNNEEFPALNDSSVATMNNSYERNPPTPIIIDSTTTPLTDYEPLTPFDGFYVNRTTSTNGTVANDVTNKNVDLSRYYTLPYSELPTTSTVALDEAIAAVDLNESTATHKGKDTNNFGRIIKKKKNLNGVSSLIKMFPLIDQVKMSYPYSKFSVGASVDLPLNLYHYLNKDPNNANQYIAPLIESCPITALYRVTKHLDDYFVPLDHLTLAKFHEKSPFSCDKYSDEILLFLYYSHVRDGLQMLAAYHLHRRGWRFHLSKCQWITLTNDQYKSYTAIMNNGKKPSSTIVKDSFWFFNVYKWCMEKIETTLDFKLFESAEVYAEFLHEATSSNRTKHQSTNITSSKHYSTNNNNSIKHESRHENRHDNRHENRHQKSSDQPIQYTS